MKLKVGDEYSVWWNTNDGRPAGNHKARILDITPYTGRYNFTHVLKLLAPNTSRGWLEMVYDEQQEDGTKETRHA